MSAMVPVRWRSSGMRATPRASAARGDQSAGVSVPMRSGPGGGADESGDQVGERGLSVAGDAGEAGDPAGAQLEVDAAQARGAADVGRGDAGERQERGARFLRRQARGRDLGADHHRGEAVAVGGGGGDLAGQPALAQHQHAGGDGHDLVQLVGDEDDGEAAGEREAQRAEERLGLLRGEHGGRLVEHEDAGVAVERLEDLRPAGARRPRGWRRGPRDAPRGRSRGRARMRARAAARS
jgi:hypothetical protein